MIVRTLKIFILLLLSVWLGVQLYHDPGYLLIAVNKWTLETTLGVAIPALLLLFLMLHATLLLLHWIMHTPGAWKAWLAKRRTLHAQEKTRQGLIEFSEGHWLQAKKHLINALPDTETPLLNYLTAARAAQEMGDSKLRDDYLREAQQSMPDAKIAVELTQAQLQLANHQWEQALATLKHLQDLSPQHPYVLKLLMHLYQEIRDWPQLIALLPALKRHSILSGQDFVTLQKHVLLEHMIELVKHNQKQAAATLMEDLPKNLACDPDLITQYCRYLFKQHDETQAEQLLRRCLQKQFNEQLIKLYAQLQGDESRLRFAEGLLKANSHSPNLYLCLGHMSQACHLWGKAKTYFEESIKLSPAPEAYAELAKLLEQLDDHPGASEAWRKGLLLTIQAADMG